MSDINEDVLTDEQMRKRFKDSARRLRRRNFDTLMTALGNPDLPGDARAALLELANIVTAPSCDALAEAIMAPKPLPGTLVYGGSGRASGADASWMIRNDPDGAPGYPYVVYENGRKHAEYATPTEAYESLRQYGAWPFPQEPGPRGD